jgi:hypothetical protein
MCKNLFSSVLPTGNAFYKVQSTAVFVESERIPESERCNAPGYGFANFGTQQWCIITVRCTLVFPVDFWFYKYLGAMHLAYVSTGVFSTIIRVLCTPKIMK